MSQEPVNCPDRASLRGFLDGALPAVHRDAVEAHIENCPACLARLERLIQKSSAAASTSEARDESFPPSSPSLAQWLGQLKEKGSPGSTAGAWTGPDQPSHSATLDFPESPTEDTTVPQGDPAAGGNSLEFLAPSDRPKSLGRLGQYEVLGRIGQGGMGIVLKAHEERLNRIVAVKVLLPALAASPLARRRFLREAQAAAAVCHEHVVTIHAVDEAAGLPYLVMQLVDGVSLQQKLNRDGALSLKEALRIGLQIASGLSAAHAQGLVHRDIKPANILLEDGVARVKITDFGLARAVDDASLTASGTIAGTPNYMSPEQARGEPVDRRSDLFSLGSVLYAMCTGEPPFRATSTVAVLRQVSDEPPRPIQVLNPDVPQWMANIITRLMAKDPAERYQTAAEVAEILASHLAELQQRGQITTTVKSPPVALRRRTLRVTEVAALLFSASALAIGLMTWWLVRTRESARDAAEPLDVAPPAKPSPPFAQVPKRTADPPNSQVAPNVTLAAALCSQAAEALKKNELPLAIGLYTEAIRHEPTSIDALLGRARSYSREEILNWPGAIGDTTEIIRRNPKNAEAFELRAAALERSGAHRPAIDDATEAIRLDPNRVWSYLHRGAAYNSLSDWHRAIVDLDELIRRAPSSPWAWFSRGCAYAGLGINDRARADIDLAIKLAPQFHHMWFQRARIHGKLNEYERAVADLNEATRLTPKAEKHWASFWRAEFYSSFSKLDPAIADYSEAIRLRGDRLKAEDAALYSGRASAYVAHDEIERALADFGVATRLDPKSARTRFNRALALIHKGHWDEAIHELEEARTLAGIEKSLAGACLQTRADCLALADRIEQADRAYDECVKFDPTRAGPILVTRAWSVDRPRGDYAAALKKLDEAAKTGMIIQFLDRGLIYARLGKPDLALADFAEVLNRVKTRPDWFAIPDIRSRWLGFMLGRGRAYLLKGDLYRALSDSDEAVRFAPRSAESRLLRAEVYAKSGKKEPADADRREAARLASDPMLELPEPQVPRKEEVPPARP
jgi:serine/threonine protein kinase/tetratricopeptide (TPR) repeat protein